MKVNYHKIIAILYSNLSLTVFKMGDSARSLFYASTSRRKLLEIRTLINDEEKFKK